MDFEKLIERVVRELDDYSLADVNNEHSARILRTAFAEVRRVAIEECEKASCVWCADGFAFVPGRRGLHKYPNSDTWEVCKRKDFSELLPPAAEVSGPGAPTAADRAHELRSMK